ncbi:hypothetical protein K4L04_08455 [Phaeobacter inhibens]|uniref:hypothetical protein n=1 Tax=Phaeobacter inhibens TaxID=221822 RepID=UPI0021A8256D|nr:hypothetical protein [Phaeobacter inhibens]UWR77952.1 hypothetical protein K4L04_08455 [Phaeobacter inhibens]
MKDKVDTPTTDIAQLAAQALASATAPERVKEIVDKQIAKTVENAIEQATRSFSPFGQDLERKISEALKINDLNLPSYNALISGMVLKQVETIASDLIEGRLKEDIAQMLKNAPKSVKLSEIVEEMRAPHESDGGYGEVVTCIIEREDPSDSTCFGPEWTIYLDDSAYYEHREKTSCDVTLRIRHGLKTDLNQDSDELHTGTISSLRDYTGVIASKGGREGFTTNKPYGLAQRLLAMYAAETVIEVDEDEVCTSVGDY